MPVNTNVLWLGEVRAGDAALAGGKGANLGELAGAGLPVPPGFVVSSAAYARFVKTIDVESELRQLRDAPQAEIGHLCSSIRERIGRAELTHELAEAILAAHGKLLDERGPSVLCAVRSSATAEDLGAASFAGQHGTYYYVDSAQLLSMIKRCWASLWSPEAVSYRRTHGIEHASVSMAVVVQEMIASEVSGVTFTANPVTGSRDELVIESSWGMGAALVDGRVTPDRYIVERDSLKIREQRIGEKRFMVAPRMEAGREARLEEVPHAMRLRETLSTEHLRTVVEWSLRCETHFKKPQDVEWAMKSGRFYLLQSRPITVIGREDIGRDVKGQYVLFKPLFENFTDPLTPLAEDLFAFTPPGTRFIHGWLYSDVAVLRAILPFDVSDEELAEHAYSNSKDAAPWRLSLAKLPLAMLCCAFVYLVFAVLLARTRALPEAALATYRELCRRVDADPAFGPEETLRRLWLSLRLFDPVGNLAVLMNITCIRFLPWMSVLGGLLRRWAPAARADADVLLASGSEGVLSADMGRGIRALAHEAKRRKRVREILAGHAPERALAELKREPEARDFLEELERFLAINGHRALKEFELRSVRWEEDPSPVLGMVRNHLPIESDSTAQERKTADARAELTRDLRRTLEKLPLESAFGLRFRLIRFAAERVKYFLKLRENTRFYHIMGLGTVRKKVLRIEADLLRLGKLKCKDDIFFLRSRELADLRAGRLGWFEVEDRIRERRIRHIRLCKMAPPKTIGIPLGRTEASSGPVAQGSLFAGQSASPGRYEGRARVILDPSIDVELEPGEVLVAPYTDPAWTPLFLTAGAAVVEIGSYLSHAGTVAREFGMPCVVDVAQATERIRTGDRILVDGDSGNVQIVARGGGAHA